MYNTPNLRRLLIDHPRLAVYGEVYGPQVQELDYGVTSPHFVAFDLWDGTSWIPRTVAFELFMLYDVPTVPVLLELDCMSEENMLNYVRAATEISSPLAARHGKEQIMEGIVLARTDQRVILKVVSDKYLEKVK